jgi:hypothetical protein
MVSKAKKFLKEHTGKAIFYASVAILLAFLIGIVPKNWKLFINVLNSIVKNEHFPIYIIFIIFAVVLFFLYKRTGKLHIEINKVQLSSKENSSSKALEQATEPNIKYFFSNNANWKINLETKSFNKNPCCNCCNPPSYLIELPPEGLAAFFGSTEKNYKCPNSGQKYYLDSEANFYAYQEAKEKYGVHDAAIEDEIKRLIKKGRLKTKD